jgi:hypothetical protein
MGEREPNFVFGNGWEGDLSSLSPEETVIAVDQYAAHAEALEREAVATWLEGITLRDQQWIDGISEPGTVVCFDGTPSEFIAAIRNGAHHRPKEQ